MIVVKSFRIPSQPFFYNLRVILIVYQCFQIDVAGCGPVAAGLSSF